MRFIPLLLIAALALPAAAVTPVTAPDVVAEKAVDYLVKNQQPNGSWQRSDREPPAVTALVLRTVVASPKYGPTSEPAKKAIAYLVSVQQANGGIYKDMLANYNTAISVSALAAVNDPALKPVIDKAVGYLKGVQWTDAIAGAGGKKIDPNDPQYGGWNYGGAKGGTADVSNTAIVLEALHDSGLKENDPAYDNALKFLTRLQNNSETNKAPWAGNDGGFIYNPGKSGEGNSAAGEYTTPDGKRMLRSYGSMTYGGLKSMIYAGISKDDARVKAAWKWVGENFTVSEHPGMAANGPESAKDGIFYYYNTMAKALAAYGEPTLTDKAGKKHDWRVELLNKLAEEQKPDGSFVGTKQWMENSPTIATSFAVLAIQEAGKDLKAHPAK